MGEHPVAKKYKRFTPGPIASRWAPESSWPLLMDLHPHLPPAMNGALFREVFLGRAFGGGIKCSILLRMQSQAIVFTFPTLSSFLSARKASYSLAFFSEKSVTTLINK